MRILSFFFDTHTFELQEEAGSYFGARYRPSDYYLCQPEKGCGCTREISGENGGRFFTLGILN